MQYIQLVVERGEHAMQLWIFYDSVKMSPSYTVATVIYNILFL